MKVLIIAFLVLTIGAGYGCFINDAINGDWLGLLMIIPLTLLSEWLFKLVGEME